MRAKRELGDDAEVAATTSETPEQVGQAGLAGGYDLPTGKHYPGRHHVVAGQTELSRQPTHASAERETARPRVRDNAGWSRHAVPLAGQIDIAE